MENLKIISKSEVNELLNWNEITETVKQALIAFSNRSLSVDTSEPSGDFLTSVVTQRTFTPVTSGKGFLLCMPGYIQGLDLGKAKKGSALTCKVVSVFEGNSKRDPPLPSIDGAVLVYDSENGQLKALIDGNEITSWRTAALSCAGAKILRGPHLNAGRKVLAIVGAGNQGRIHALAFINQFQFDEVRIWNRTTSRSQDLVTELKKLGVSSHLTLSPQECVQGANVIITATSAAKPLLKDDWIRADALILAVGVGRQQELSPEVYKRALVYVESKEGAKNELSHLTVEGELGEIALGKIPQPPTDKIVVFQSLGSGVEDAAVACLIFKLKNDSDSQKNKAAKED